MMILIVATLMVALMAAAAVPLLVLWACAESREGDPAPRQVLFSFSFLRNSALLRTLHIGVHRPLQLTYRRDARGRFRKVA
jgi:hypothetical protein